MATAAEGRPKDDQTGNEGKFPHEVRAEVEVIGTGIEVRKLMYHEYRRVQQGFPADVFDFCASDYQERWITTAIVD